MSGYGLNPKPITPRPAGPPSFLPKGAYVSKTLIPGDLRNAIEDAYARRCAKHGTQPFHSPAEMLGVILEEFDEVKDAVRANASSSIDDEVMDVLVVCVHWLSARGAE